MKTIYITELQRKQLNSLILENEGTNLKKARNFLRDKGYDENQRQQILNSIRTDIPNSRLQQCKFMLGVVRMYLDGQLRDGRAIANLNKTLKYVASDAHVNEYDYNLNNESLDDLVNRFSGVAQNDLQQSMDSSNARQLTVNNNYTIIPIDSPEEAAKYGDYTSWCVTHDKKMYNTYTHEGTGRFYFCLHKGFENEPVEVGENCPLDSYGLSMIAVSVNEDGSVNTITCRWNHDNGGNDNIMNIEQLEDVIGRNFYQTFKPYTKEELMAKGVIPFSMVQELLDSGKNPQNIFTYVYPSHVFDDIYIVIFRKKYNLYNFTKNKILLNKWYDYINFWFNEIGVIELNNRQILINKNFEIIGDWFNFIDIPEEQDAIKNGFILIKFDTKKNIFNVKNGKLLLKKPVDLIYNIKEGFAKIISNGKCNFVDVEGNLLSEEWFDDMGRICSDLFYIRKNNNFNFVDNNGNLLSEQWFDTIFTSDSEGNSFYQYGYEVIGVSLNGLLNIFSKIKKKLLSNEWFEHIYICKSCNNIFYVEKNGKENCLNLNGKILFPISWNMTCLGFDFNRIGKAIGEDENGVRMKIFFDIDGNILEKKISQQNTVKTESKKSRKTIIITESQKKKLKKAIAAQDQVGGKVNAGVMDGVVGMCENIEDDKYELGAEKGDISPYYHVNESNEETITLYHGVNRKGLEYNLEQGCFVPRVCSEGGPKAIWLSEKQYNYEFTFAFDIPKSEIEQLSNVDYIFTNKISFNDFNCRLVKTSISSYLHDIVIETNILNDKLSKIQFRYFPDLGITMWKEFKQYPNILEKFINPYIEKYQQLSESIDNSKENRMIDINQIINSSEFKAWFGNSKVVDKNGNPLIVHHGSPNFEGDKFSKEKVGLSMNSGEGGVFCTTQDMSWAKRFSYPASPGTFNFTVKLDYSHPGDILSGFLKLEHPLDFFHLTEQDWKNIMNMARDTYYSEIIERNPRKWLEDRKLAISQYNNHRFVKHDISSAIRSEFGDFGEQLKRYGYDGYIASMSDGDEEDRNAIEYCFIEPNQFKSIYSLAFNPNSDSIYEGRKKVIKNDEGEIVPDKCDKCGGDVVLQIHGEPVYLCKDCGKYFGTMPFHLKENKLNENSNDRKINNYIKQKFGLTDFQDIRNKVMEVYKVIPYARIFSGRYLLGVFRLLFDDNIPRTDYTILNKILYIINHNWFKYGQHLDNNLNNLSINELINFVNLDVTLSPKLNYVEKTRKVKNGYTITHVDSFEEMDVLCDGEWCISHDEFTWDDIVSDETVYLVQNEQMIEDFDIDYEKNKEKWNEIFESIDYMDESDMGSFEYGGTPYDLYGLSRFVVMVSDYGISSCYSRYNIPNCLDGNFLNEKQLSELLGVNPKEAFPYIKSEEINENIELEDKWNGEGEKLEPLKKIKKIPPVLYHTSYKKNRENILKNGIFASVGDEYRDWWNYEGPNGEVPDNDELEYLVFLTTKPTTWSDNYFLDQMDIFEIDTKQLDNTCFYLDPDKYMALKGSICYTGNIPPSAIKLYDSVYRGKSINESYYGDLYHTTTVSHLYNILKNNCIYLSEDEFGHNDSRMGDDMNVVCLSRDKNFDINKSNNVVRITLDGESMSTSLRNAKIHPYNYYEKNGEYVQPHESEERLYGTDIYPLSKYCKAIDIWPTDKVDFDYCDDIEIAYDALEKEGIDNPTDMEIIQWYLKHIKEDFPLFSSLINIHEMRKSNSINENVELEIKPDEVDLSSFNIKKKLNPKFWIDGHLDSRIRLKLLDISDDFIEYLGIDPDIVKDVIMTGSLANFNWNEEFSDIDLHVLLDYSDVDENTEFVKQYFMSQKNLWNNEHQDLKIFGFPIEVYVQDINEKHDSSGVYSLDRDKWLREPDRDVLATSKVNKEFIKNKVSDYVNKIDKLVYLYKKSKGDEYKLGKIAEIADKLWDEIKNSRKIGFEKSGGKEINNNNIVFKSLRRQKYLDKLYDLKTKTYDKLNSL